MIAQTWSIIFAASESKRQQVIVFPPRLAKDCDAMMTTDRQTAGIHDVTEDTLSSASAQENSIGLYTADPAGTQCIGLQTWKE